MKFEYWFPVVVIILGLLFTNSINQEFQTSTPLELSFRRELMWISLGIWALVALFAAHMSRTDI